MMFVHSLGRRRRRRGRGGGDHRGDRAELQSQSEEYQQLRVGVEQLGHAVPGTGLHLGSEPADLLQQSTAASLFVRGLVPHCVSQARICLGYYASKGFSNPLKQRGAGRFQNIEVTDYATLRRKRSKVLSAVLAMACPHPRTTRVRFSPSLKYSYIDVFGLFYFCREVQASLAFRAWGAVDVCVEGHSSGGIHRHGDGGHHHRGGP